MDKAQIRELLEEAAWLKQTASHENENMVRVACIQAELGQAIRGNVIDDNTPSGKKSNLLDHLFTGWIKQGAPVTETFVDHFDVLINL